MPDQFYRDTPEYRRAEFMRGFRKGFLQACVIGFWAAAVTFAGRAWGVW